MPNQKPIPASRLAARLSRHAIRVAALALAAPGLSFAPAQASEKPPVALEIKVAPEGWVMASYRLSKPVTALHFAQQLDGYREQNWLPVTAGYRWTAEGDGERIERADGKPFNRLTLRIPIRYRALPKAYAPFSPFSEGSTLIYSGQFHTCLSAPCEGDGPLPVTVTARAGTIGVNGTRTARHAKFVSQNAGTEIFAGTLSPVDANGFIAVIDPGLPQGTAEHLKQSLFRATSDFARIYGPLSFRPELYISIDARPRDDGNESTQGGTLPRQIFMHFDGAHARERVMSDSPYWLDWFVAHESAHLFQQDRTGGVAGDDILAWIHEGEADAMAALELAKSGDGARSYVAGRIRQARDGCLHGLTRVPLDKASSTGNFDMHYQCGLLIWLALDGDLRTRGRDGLHALDKVFFDRVRKGAAWNDETLFTAARDAGVPDGLLQTIRCMNTGNCEDTQAEVPALLQRIAPDLTASGAKAG